MFLRNQVKNDSVRFFETEYHQLIERALDNVSVSPKAEKIVQEFAFNYCNSHQLNGETSLKIENYFRSWAKEILERGYGSVW